MDHLASGVRFQLYPLARKRTARTLICYQVGSRRVRDTFKGDEAAAQKHCKELARTLTSGEHARPLPAVENRIWITAKADASAIGRPVDAIVREYREAKEILGKVSVIEAARFYRKSHTAIIESVPLAAIVEEMLAAIKARSSADRLRYHEDLKQRLGKLTDAFPNATAGDITAPDLEAWLSSFNGLSPRSSNKYRASVLTLFNFGAGLNDHYRPAKRYFPKEHAASNLPKLEDRGGKRACFNVREMGVLLDAAPEESIPWFVLGAYAGLRQSEIWRLEWSDISFESWQISLDRFQAKTYGERHIQMLPILRAWLAPYENREGRVAPFAHPNGLTRAMSRVAKGLNVVVNRKPVPLAWKDNGCRHAYATHRIPVVGYAKTAEEMGTSERKLLQNYRMPMTEEKAKPYWELFPRDRRVIEFDFVSENAG